MRGLILADGIEAEQEHVLIKALDYYEQHRIDFEDAYMAALAESHSHRRILTFNTKDFTRTGVECYSPTDVLSRA